MKRRIIVGDSYSLDESSHFHAMIGVLGYERRSSFIARSYPGAAERKIAVAFPEEDYASYLANREYLRSNGFSMIPYAAEDFQDRLGHELSKIAALTDPEPARVLIDVSSMSRPMIAQIILVLQNAGSVGHFLICFTYCPSEYVAPSRTNAPVAVSRPVLPEFAGWSSTPDLPIAVVVGLGYEHNWALGTLEYLEPAVAVAFIPSGEDSRYDEAVREANEALDLFHLTDRTYHYDVHQPLACFARLEAVAYGLSLRCRTILVPFGPKIFALLSLLTAAIHRPKITVWRVSGDTEARPGDRVASGRIVTLQVLFSCGVEASSIVRDYQFLRDPTMLSEA